MQKDGGHIQQIGFTTGGLTCIMQGPLYLFVKHWTLFFFIIYWYYLLCFSKSCLFWSVECHIEISTRIINRSHHNSRLVDKMTSSGKPTSPADSIPAAWIRNLSGIYRDFVFFSCVPLWCIILYDLVQSNQSDFSNFTIGRFYPFIFACEWSQIRGYSKIDIIFGLVSLF